MTASQRYHDPVLLVRRRGDVGERQRSCHLVPVPVSTLPPVLTALCGERIEPGAAELLPEPDGMPCVTCLLVRR